MEPSDSIPSELSYWTCCLRIYCSCQHTLSTSSLHSQLKHSIPSPPCGNDPYEPHCAYLSFTVCFVTLNEGYMRKLCVGEDPAEIQCRNKHCLICLCLMIYASGVLSKLLRNVRLLGTKLLCIMHLIKFGFGLNEAEMFECWCQVESEISGMFIWNSCKRLLVRIMLLDLVDSVLLYNSPWGFQFSWISVQWTGRRTWQQTPECPCWRCSLGSSRTHSSYQEINKQRHRWYKAIYLYLDSIVRSVSIYSTCLPCCSPVCSKSWGARSRTLPSQKAAWLPRRQWRARQKQPEL